MSGSGRKRLGGLGALFFLGTLGVLAWVVQQQSVSPEREALRAPATALSEPSEETKVVALPWEDRLDVAAAQATPIFAPPTQAGAPPTGTGTPAADQSAPTATSEQRLVQTIEDGHRILYTLDPVLQDAALTIFRNRGVPYAAAVVIDLRDNSVLAFAGHSSADAQVDALEILTTPWAPAASVFKLVTAASLLEDGGVLPATSACFHGGLQGITDDLLVDNPTLDTRCESLSSAIAHSHNVVVAKLAQAHLDADELARTSHSLLWDAQIPFEFPIEPSPAQFPADPRERAKVAAGFWHADLSPMHAVVLASIFARGGMYQPPHIVAQVIGPDGADLTPLLTPEKRAIAKDVATQVGKMMVGTTTDGTAKKSFYAEDGTPYIAGMVVAGKTGSLTGKRAPAYNYNWFVGYAPADDPQIAFAVVLANEAEWKIKAHYAGRRLVQLWLERRKAIDSARNARIAGEHVVLPGAGGVTPSAPSPAREVVAAVPDPLHDLPPVPGPVRTPADDVSAATTGLPAPDEPGAPGG